MNAGTKVLDALLPSRREGRALAERNGRLEAFLRAIPVDYCGWDNAAGGADGGGTQAVSPGFCRLLGMEKVTGFHDVQAALSPGDGAALAGLFERLNAYGEPFELGVFAEGSGRSLKILGKRGLADSEGAAFSVLWALDVTEFAQAAMRGAEAAARLEQKESAMRAALNALPFPVWTRGADLGLSWCNKFYARVVDDTAAAVVADQKELPVRPAGKGAKDEIAPRVLAQRAMAKLAPQSARGHVIIEGERRLVEVVEIPLPADKRVIGVALDATREEELEASYQRLAASQREVLEQMRTAIAMFDQETRIEFYNAAYEQLTGLSGTFLDQKPRMTDIIDRLRESRKLPEQADYRQFKQAWLHRFTSLLEPYEEMQYLPDGTVLRMIAMPRPMGGLLLTYEDVTGRLNLEMSYNTLVAVRQETMDNLAEGIAVFGEDGKLKLSNQAFARLWKITAEEAAAAPHVTQLVGKAQGFFAPGEWEGMKQLLLGNALEREQRKGRMKRADGTVLEFSVVPLPDGNILNAWFDITDTVKVEHALVEKNAALEEAERLKTDFLANVSYQLRTPLNAIMGFAEMLGQQYFGKLNERQAEYASGIIEAGQRLISLVNDILDLSTIEAGYLKLYPAEVRVKDVMTQVADLTQEWARKQSLETVIRCEDPDLIVMADERRVKQVLLNLISNAINYSPGGGVITLSVKRDGDFALLSVRDTGIGIPPEDLSRVFTPFEKIRSRKAQRRSGAGLGLALVKSIVQLHGGTVAIDSAEGVGTTVEFRLPVKA